ncbi:MAG: hypothetical protein ACK4MM_07185, partial [Fervidobacterium sp.]
MKMIKMMKMMKMMKVGIKERKIFEFYFIIFFITFFLITTIAFSQNTQNTQDILVLYTSSGLLYKNVEKDFEFPSDWVVLQVTADKWYVERKSVPQEYVTIKDFPEGKYNIVGNIAIFEDGNRYVNTPFGLAKIVSDGKIFNVLRTNENSEALFSVPGGYRIYYTLKGDTLEQFFEIRSPIDKAFVILSTAPEEGPVRLSYSKMAVATEQFAEISSGGRKIFVLGYLEGLTNGLNIRNKVLSTARKDTNKIELAYNYTYAWQPSDYCIEIKTTDELPAGNVYVYADILGKVVPIGTASMPDLNKEGEIFVSKSWQVYHSWDLTKMTRSL